jgi:hypothetical protein
VTATTHSTSVPLAYRPASAGLRLVRLHVASRRVPAALALLAAFGLLLGVGLHYHWTVAGGAAGQLLVPLTIETGAAAVMTVSTYGPFGEPERATGRWLPWLRLGTCLALTAVAFGALAAGATAGTLSGGTLALLRDLAGTAGLGLLSAVVFGGAFGWVGPMSYLLVTEATLNANPTTPWIWAARPSHDHGAALCAGLVLVAGTVAITVLGTRDRGNHSDLR